MNTPFLQVFTAKIPQYQEENVYPPIRQAEIAAANNEKTRAEKSGVWKLLQYAVEQTFSRPFTDFSFTKNENGKWLCKDFYLSLSHSKNAVAVALSSSPVGIDIQIDKPLKNVSVAERILTDKEMEILQNSPKSTMNAYLVGVWAQKEAVFKRNNDTVFTPKKIKLGATETLQTIEIEKEKYFLALSSELLSLLRVRENVIL